MSGERTTEELLEDRPRRCDACRNLLTREELRDPHGGCLCTPCATVIDRQTDEALERAHYEEE